MDSREITTSEEIIAQLPYRKPFLFVDELTHLSPEGISGRYTFQPTEFYYQGHFKVKPITPGVILTEVMAQIGVVSLGIYLLSDQYKTQTPEIALTSNNIDFYLPVLPGETVTVVSEKQYFRFNKLQCNVKMLNADGKLVCRGTIAGMIKP